MFRVWLASLRVRLLLPLLLAVIPASGLLLYTTVQERGRSVAEVQHEALLLARAAATQQQPLIEGGRRFLTTLAQFDEVHGHDAAACSALLATTAKEYPLFANLVAINPAGNVICSAVPLPQAVNTADRAWFKRALSNRTFTVGEYQIGGLTDKPVLVLAHPVVSDAGLTQVVIVAALDLAWLNQLVAAVELPAGAAVTVIDRQGTILARSPDPEQWLGQSLPEAPLVQAMLTQGESTAELPGVDGVKRLFAFRPMAGTLDDGGVYVAIGIPKAVAYASVNRILVHSLAVLGLVAILGIVSAWVGAKLVLLRPISALVRATQRLGAGDLSARTGLPDRYGELTQLARAFDDMTASLQLRQAEAKQAEEALRASEERFRMLIEGVRDYAIYMLDRDGRVASWNAEAERIKGYRADEIIGQHVACFYPNEARMDGIPEHALQKAAADGRFAVEDWHVRKDGSRFWARAVITALRDEAGQLRGFANVTHDITERKQAEEALRETKSLLEKTFAGLNEAVFVVDATTRTIITCNPAVEQIFGYRMQEAVGRNTEFLYPDREAYDAFGQELRHALDAYGIHRSERQMQRKDGSIIFIELTVTGFPDDGGSRSRVVSVCRDITERKRTEEALRRYAERLEILHSIDQAILAVQSPQAIADAALRQVRQLVSCWRASIILFDFKMSQGSVFATVDDAGTPYPTATQLSLNEIGELDVKALQAGQVHQVEDVAVLNAPPAVVRALQSVGLRSYVRVPLLSQGELLGSLNLWFDRTGALAPEQVDIACEVADLLAVAIQQALLHEQVRRHAMELEDRVTERTARLETINAELESFSYSVSHDLRAPLRSIDGFSQALMEDYATTLDAQGQDYLQRIRGSTQRMGALIDALLALSRVTRAELQREPVDLSAMAQAIAAELQRQGPARQAEFIIPNGLVVSADTRLLRVVLENLLSNAWKFTAKQPQAHIEFGAQPQQDGSQLFFVRDNGVGFDMAYADKLFGAFQRLHRVGEFPGTGIGLATVQRIIHRHGGHVWAEAEVDRGATFYFTL